MVNLGASLPPRVTSRPNIAGTSKPSALSLSTAIIQVAFIAISLALLAQQGRQDFRTALIGYILTPLLSASLLGLARFEFMNKALNPNFDAYTSQKRFNISRFLAVVAFFVGLIHMYDLAWLMASH